MLGAETLPLVLFLLIGGAAADRLNRRVVMLSADVVRAVAQGVLAAWILAGHPPLWGFLVTQALVGTGNAFFTPAMTGLIPEVAPAGVAATGQRPQQHGGMVGSSLRARRWPG